MENIKSSQACNLRPKGRRRYQNFSEESTQEKTDVKKLTESLDDDNELTKITEIAHEEFEVAAKSAEDKFKPVSMKPVCSQLQRSLIECYERNPGKPLICAKELSKLKDCVLLAKKETLEKNLSSDNN